MKYNSQILSLILAVVIFILSIKLLRVESSHETTISTTQEITHEQRQAAVIENILTRRSCYSYSNRSVEQSKIDTLLKAGMAAPSVGDNQPWELVVISDREVLDKIVDVSQCAQPITNAPLAIAVCARPAPKSDLTLRGFWVQDCSAVSENILLSAHALGLGATWCGIYPNNNSGRVTELRELLNIPPDVMPLNVIIIGYPDDIVPAAKDKWNPEKVHYNTFRVPYQPPVVDSVEVVALVQKPKGFVPSRTISSEGVADDVSGFGGSTPVEIDMSGDTIYQVRILPNKEYPDYMNILYDGNLDKKWNGMTLREASEAEVDIISGATLSSEAIIESLRRAAKSAL